LNEDALCGYFSQYLVFPCHIFTNISNRASGWKHSYWKEKRSENGDLPTKQCCFGYRLRIVEKNILKMCQMKFVH